MATNGFASASFLNTASTTGSAGANSIYLTKITVLRTATVAAILLSVGVVASGISIRAVIYDSSHSALLAAGSTLTSMVVGYNRLPLSSTVSLAAGTYYVGYVCANILNVHIDGTQTASSWWVSGGQSVASPANPLVGGSSQNNGLLIALEFDGSTAATSGFGPDYSSGVTLGGANNTTATTTAASLMGARTVIAQSLAGGGKYYAEVVATGTLNANTRVGLVTATWPLSTISTTNSWSVLYSSNGGILYNSGAVATIASFVAGDVIGIAYDTATTAVWFNKNNGVWNSGGSANPATGIGGFVVGTVPGGWPVMLYAGSNTAATFTLRDTSGLLQYTLPSGFAAWSGFSPAVQVQARAWVMA